MGFKTKIKKGLRYFFNLFKEEKIKPVIVPTDKDNLLGGKIALITGGSSGIGYAIAKAFISAGSKVIICGTNEEKLNKAVANLQNLSGGGYG